MVDTYTKTVLTVVAVALLAIAFRHLPEASAQLGVYCGASINMPCFVKRGPLEILNVKLQSAPPF